MQCETAINVMWYAAKPSNPKFVKEKADWLTFNDGGYGAARDVADLILDAKGLLENIHDGYWQQ